MRIALLSFEYPPDTGFGGIGSYTWHHARALVKLGHEVQVLAGSPRAARPEPQHHDGVCVTRLHGAAGLGPLLRALGAAGLPWTRRRLETGIDMYLGLRRLLERARPDLVEMPECGAEGLLVSRWTPLPTLVRFHSPAALILPFYEVNAGDRWSCARLESLAASRADFFSSCSRFLAEELRPALGRGRHVEVIPNGIDLELFDAAPRRDARAALGIPADRPLVLFAGRLERRKGIDLCAEIAALVLQRFPVAFAFAGGEASSSAARALAAALERVPHRGSVHFPGRLDPADLRSLLAQTQVFLLPSLWESQPYAGLEAMASGAAVVSSDCGGMPELIRDGTDGLLAKSGCARAHADAVIQLLEDAGLRQRLADSARRRVEARHRDVDTARRSVDYYRSCLAGAARVRS